VPQLTVDGKTYALGDKESVLNCLTRHNISIPHSCGSGICQSCVVRAVEGKPTPASQKSLKPSQRERGVFLACSCVPEEDLHIQLGDEASRTFSTTVLSLKKLSQDVMRLRLNCPSDFKYRAGQYINLHHPVAGTRCYSLASVHGLDPHLELHIKLVPQGLVSSWVHNELAVGNTITISEPLGDCHYNPDKPDAPMLLIATGCGLAPLYGIIRDALHNQHRGEISLYHSSRSKTGIYLYQDCEGLQAKHENFRYIPSVSEDEKIPDGLHAGRSSDLALQQHRALKDYQVYLCGEPEMVNTTKRKAFLAGASMSAIHSDPFVYFSPTN